MMTQNRLRNLDLGTLRSFVTIAETGSMTRAASRLFMTQSAISMQIKRLENSLGLSVFERSAQGMSPTTEGEQLLRQSNAGPE
jgi:DNA-binding transcriptional LysR family regulator